MKNIFIGTSGWSYKYWKGPFYPDKLAHNKFFQYYAAEFNTVELNNSFYRLPAEETIIKWREAAPAGFIFSVKASRYITHIKRLIDCEGITRFIGPVSLFADKLGPLLFQLPANFKYNPAVIENFISNLPEGYQYVFEFRSPVWFNQEIYQLLAKYNTAFCIFDFNGLLSPVLSTASLVYIRLHGPEGKYNGDYSHSALQEWAAVIKDFAGQGKKVYCYFDNDTAGYAPKNCRELIEILNLSS